MITTQQKADKERNSQQAKPPAQGVVTALANATPKSAPSVVEMNHLATLFNQGQQQASLTLALEMTRQHPLHGFGWKVLGAIYQQQGLKDQALDAFKKAALHLPKDAEVHFNLANGLCDAGELKSAVASYKKAIKINPMFTQAHYNLGLAYQDLTQLKDAEASFKFALKQAPNNALMHSNLGVLMKNQKRYKEADAYFMQALKINPDLVEVHYQLGVSLGAQDRFEEAEKPLLLALSKDPNIYEAYCILNKVYQHLKRYEEAEACLRQVIAIKPDYADAYFNLGNYMKTKGNIDEAEQHFRIAISIKPDFAEAINNLGIALMDKDANNEAEATFKQAIEVKPDYLEAYKNLGFLFSITGKLKEAESVYLSALDFSPNSKDLLNYLSVLMVEMGESEKAQHYLDVALKIDRKHIPTYINLSLNYICQGNTKAAKLSCLQGMEAEPDNIKLLGNMLCALSYSAEDNVSFYKEKAIQYGEILSKNVIQKYTAWNFTSPVKTLRVGIVSGDLRHHVVSYFLENVINHIVGTNIELIAYTTINRIDHVSNRLKQQFSEWHSIADLDDETAAATIHNHGIHVLVDLSGHSGFNRLPVFAWKPAPVQVSWLGYWASTGVAEIDYVLTDKVSLPETEQTQFTEKVQYLPNTRMCFAPPITDAKVSALPALSNGYVTFGSFQSMAKISDDVIELWVKVLQSVPNSNLRLQSKALCSERATQSAMQRFTSKGIDPARIVLLPFSSREDYLLAHDKVDILLDSFPFSGGTTTCEALWMGVPTLTLAGETMVSRQGASLLNAVGLSDWIAETKDEYLEKAILFSQNLSYLSKLRAGLRSQALASALYDGRLFARNLAAAFWSMWQQVVSTESDSTEMQNTENTSVVNQDLKHAQALSNKSQLEQTVENCTHSLRLTPNNIALHCQLAEAYKALGKLDDAILHYQKGLTLNPNDAGIHNNLAVIYLMQERYAEAATCSSEAIALQPKMAEAYNILGVAKLAQGQLVAAQQALLKAIEMKPDYVGAHSNLASLLKDRGQISEALKCFKNALNIEPRNLTLLSNLMFSMNYLDQSCELILPIARQYGDIVNQQTQTRFTDWQCNYQASRIRVGLVSSDLRDHAVAYFLENMLQHIDPSRVELLAYVTDSREDATTNRLKPYFAQWHSIRGLTDNEAAQRIHDDGVHILLDLSGHTGGNRLPVFAYKPAPVQASWLGYYATTGLPQMDYWIADETSLPATLAPMFTEQVKYLPHSRMCFTPPANAPEVSALPALSNGYVTFGCFQNMAKVNEVVMQLWAQVMQAIPNAKLRWQCKSLTDIEVQESIKKRMANCGLDLTRVSLFGDVSRQAYLAAHAEIDIILDTLPFSGGTTTCEALWMGVPTLTLVGQTLVARQGASLLTAAGLHDWVVKTPADFVQKAQSICQNLNALANLRANLRSQVAKSPLFDGELFARNFETLLREMWQEHMQNRNVNGDKTDQQSKVAVQIISATRMSEQAFWRESALGLSLKRHLQQDARLSAKVSYENTRGLSEIFNDSIHQADDDAVMVFIHDDVWIDEPNFADTVLAGLEMFDVIGVAGNKRRLPNQPSWAFVDLKFTWDDKQNLSGRISHGEKAIGKLKKYGKMPALCELLDGVFLATKVSTLRRTNLSFDTQFDFHFYDMDFCRSARQAGLSLGTWLISLTHQSTGNFVSQSWWDKYQRYVRKWEDMNTATFEGKQADLEKAITDVYAVAFEHQQAGEIDEAVSLYIKILEIHPKHAETNHNLGFIEAHTKSVNEALPRFEAAVMAKPESEQFWVSYIDALVMAGETGTAISAIKHGLQFGLTETTAQVLKQEIDDFINKKNTSIHQVAGGDSTTTKFIIVAPAYTDKSAGIRVLHELCDDLNKLGHPTAICFFGNGTFNCTNNENFYGSELSWYALKDNAELEIFVNEGIVIYPEIITGNPLNAPRVVRYLLNSEGNVAKNKMEASPGDFMLTYSPVYYENPHAVLLKMPVNLLFNQDGTLPALERRLDVTYIGKGHTYNQCYVLPNTLEVTRQYPITKPELALLLKNTRYFYTWDHRSATVTDALHCGAIPVFLSVAPYASLDELDPREFAARLGTFARIENGKIHLSIPENYADRSQELIDEYLADVASFRPQLEIVVKQITNHFSLA